MLNDPTLNRLESDLNKLHIQERELTNEIRQAQTKHQQNARQLEEDLNRELERIDRERKRLSNDIHFKESELSRHRDDLIKKQSN